MEGGSGKFYSHVFPQITSYRHITTREPHGCSTAFSERPLGSPKKQGGHNPERLVHRQGQGLAGILSGNVLIGGMSWGCTAERGVHSPKPLQCDSLS